MSHTTSLPKPTGPAASPSSSSTPNIAEETEKQDPLHPSQPTSLADPLTTTKPHLSQRKKWALLAIFSLAFVIDCWNNAAMYVLTGPLCRDLSVVIEQNSWVITSYSVTFAAFLLFWGRMSDIFSAKSVFAFGFVGLGVINLLISFLPDKYSFFVFRAISGIAAAAVIPSSFRLIVFVFEPEELGRALTLYGMSGAMGAISGTIAGGVFVLIPGSGQMVGWRWFFRVMAAIILPIAIGSFYWIPSPPPAEPITHKIKRLDLVGSLSMLTALVLLILGLTLGATVGWRTPHFLVPFLLSFLVFPFFFIWEARIPFDYALLPPSAWRIPNFATFVAFALFGYAWPSTSLALIETFTTVNRDSYIIAAVRIMPVCLSATVASVFLAFYPQYVAHPRWPLTIGMLAMITASALIASSNGAKGADYWKFVFPGNLIGGAGMIVVQTATNVGILSAVPPEMAGVAGAVLQVAMQTGQVLSLSVQAGLLTIQPGNFGNWVNVRASFIFVAGLALVWLVGFLIFYKPAKAAAKGADESAEVN